MGSSNKTTKLNLNKWLETDKPKRSDFIYDNEIIDEVLGEHLEDYNMHLSAVDRKSFSAPTTIYTYVGDGSDSRTLTMSIPCTGVFVIQSGKPPVEKGSDENLIINFSYALNDNTSSPALMLRNKTSLTIKNYTSPNGEVINLNSGYTPYYILCIR